MNHIRLVVEIEPPELSKGLKMSGRRKVVFEQARELFNSCKYAQSPMDDGFELRMRLKARMTFCTDDVTACAVDELLPRFRKEFLAGAA